MIYNNLGKTGLTVSKIGFGCAALGNEYGDLDQVEGVRAVHTAIDYGINFFDTSPYYGRTLSETRLGKALKGKRDQVILATKGGRFEQSAETGFDFSYDGILAMCEASLSRLKTDYIDVYQLHDIEFGDKGQIINEAIPALFKLKEMGKVRHIGVTGYPLSLLCEMVETQELDVVLSFAQFNLINQAMHDDLLLATLKKQTGLINASITNMGLLTAQGAQDWYPVPQSVRDIAKKMGAYCQRHGVDITDLAIQFALQHDKADVTLLGTRTVQELSSSVALLNKEIDEDHLQAVLIISNR